MLAFLLPGPHTLHEPTSYEVRKKSKNSLEDIATFVEEKYHGESGIIYCFSRSE
jgi:superfamily II DNA helicase RecQ